MATAVAATAHSNGSSRNEAGGSEPTITSRMLPPPTAVTAASTSAPIRSKRRATATSVPLTAKVSTPSQTSASMKVTRLSCSADAQRAVAAVDHPADHGGVGEARPHVGEQRVDMGGRHRQE